MILPLFILQASGRQWQGFIELEIALKSIDCIWLWLVENHLGIIVCIFWNSLVFHHVSWQLISLIMYCVKNYFKHYFVTFNTQFNCCIEGFSVSVLWETVSIHSTFVFHAIVHGFIHLCGILMPLFHTEES